MRRVLMPISVVFLAGSTVFGVRLGALPQTGARPGGVLLIRPNDVQWTDYPGRPGVKLAMLEGDLSQPGPFLMRVRFPANYRLGPHKHPGIEHTIVISGSLQIGYGTKEGGSMETLGPGTVLITPAGTPHFLLTTVETVVQTHGLGPWGSTAVK